MKILVTGGLGFVGRHLVEELRTRQNDVWLTGVHQNADPKYLRCDAGEFRQVARIFENHKFDCVYHLAAEFGRWNGEDFYETLWKSNVIGTKNMIRLQERHRFRMVFFSSSEVYGDWAGVMSEDVMDKHEIKQLNDYAMTKWVGEMQILNSGQALQTETVRVRLFNLYGPGEPYSTYRSALVRFIFSALVGLPYTVYASHTRSWLFVDDAVQALANIVTNFKPGEVYNIASAENVNMKLLSDVILRLCGGNDKLVAVKDEEGMTTHHKNVDNSKAKRDLGLQMKVSLEEGLRRTVEWMRETHTDKSALRLPTQE
jgi:dTDP-glucose 4,6-dehydratase